MKPLLTALAIMAIVAIAALGGCSPETQQETAQKEQAYGQEDGQTLEQADQTFLNPEEIEIGEMI
ncbi:hypothetical protein HY640_04325 [Candidatus Woesearchaeota archaeon]|nr:hypothetical protein [Candidatus Woesearchaeota archaeon]